MRTLRDQMAVDAAALLSTADLGERAMYVAYGESAGTKKTVRFIGQPERQTIRRAFIWTKVREIDPQQGDLFTITRNREDMVYRLMYSDTAETGIQRHICHERITTTVKVMDKARYKSERGADQWTNANPATHRAKIVLESGETVTRNNRRRLRGEYQIYFEELPALNTDQVIVDSDGRAYGVVQIDNPVDRMDLPFITASRLDA